MEQTVTTHNGSNSVMNSLVKPTIVKDVVLLAPGVWTGDDLIPTEYTAEEIKNGFDNSDWENMNLFLDHKDVKGSAVADWIGFARNARLAAGGELRGDLEIWHPLISLFIKQAKAKFGVSATMKGNEIPNAYGNASIYKINSFRSMSLVDDPGCKVSWLPKMLSIGEKGDKKVTGGIVEEDKIKSLSMGEVIEKEISNLNLYNCKEVKEMTEENQTQKNLEKHENETEEELKKIKEKEKAKKEKSDEEVKNLHSKIDKLTDVVTGLSETIKTLSANEEKVEPKVEEAKEKTEEKSEETEKELNSVNEKLEETTKELAALKEEVNSPDKKTLAGPNNSENVSTDSANAGMLGFLREQSNISIY